MGLEPTTLGTTIQCSNQLSYIHHVFLFLRRCKGRDYFLLCKYFVNFFAQRAQLFSFILRQNPFFRSLNQLVPRETC